VVNAVLGTIIAWVLVRDEFRGKWIVNSLIDLPFALPTIVAGLTLLALYGPRGPFGFDVAFTRFGRLDAVVNNAGIMIFKPIEAHDEADLLRVLRVDFCGAFWFVKHAFLRCTPGAAIVNVASVHAVQTTPLVAAYAAAKAALLSLTRSAAIEGQAKGIRVNAVLPGAIETPMLRENPNLQSGAERLDPADVGRPEDVAAAVAWLASDDAVFVTGAELRVDGGRLARL